MATEKAAVPAAAAETKVYASVEDIINSGGTEVEYDFVPGFRPGEVFRIGSVSSGEIMDWSDEKDPDKKRTAGLRLITKSLVGPEPENRRYADDPKYIEVFRKVRHKETERVVKAILKLNGMNVKGMEEAKND